MKKEEGFMGELEKFKQKVKLIGKEDLNEANTIQTLVNPILNIMDWDTTDFQEVESQSNENGGGIPDIALKDKDSKRKKKKVYLYIEVKKVKVKNLKMYLNQGLEYCYSSGVKYLILTNGIKWMFYAPFSSKYEEENRIFAEINFKQDTIEHITKVLLDLLLKKNYTSNKIEKNVIHHFTNHETVEDQADAIINEYSNSEKIVSLIMEKVDKSKKKNNLEKIINQKYEFKGEKKIQTESFNVRQKKIKSRDKIVNRIKKQALRSNEKPRIRDGELSFKPGSVDLGFFIRVNLMHRQKKISFQVIVMKNAEEKYKKMKNLVPRIKEEYKINFKEENSVNNRSDKKNHCFNFSYMLHNKEELKDIEKKVENYVNTINLVRKELFNFIEL